MQYQDNGITLDYDNLRSSYPSAANLIKFYQQQIYQNAQASSFVNTMNSNQLFKPPIVTDFIKRVTHGLNSKKIQFKEDKVMSKKIHKQRAKPSSLEKAILVESDQEVSIIETPTKKHTDLIEEEVSQSIIESTVENTPGNISGDEQEDDEEQKQNSDKKATKAKKAKRPCHKSKAKRWTTIKRRGMSKKKTEEDTDKVENVEKVTETVEKKKEIINDVKKVKIEINKICSKKVSPSNSNMKIVKSTIPCFWDHYETDNMYEINRRFCFDPTKPSL